MLIITNALYFLALVNPASKIFILSTMQPRLATRDLQRVAIRASVAAFFILVTLMAGGCFLLRDIFKMDIYSLKVAGGIILFMIGLLAVQRGHFFEKADTHGSADISIVPLAAPMIAGPGTITGAISLSSEHGFWITLCSVSLALLINLLLMLFATRIGLLLERLRATGPLIRITGLVVAAVAAQMVLDGLGSWLQTSLGNAFVP